MYTFYDLTIECIHSTTFYTLYNIYTKKRDNTVCPQSQLAFCVGILLTIHVVILEKAQENGTTRPTNSEFLCHICQNRIGLTGSPSNPPTKKLNGHHGWTTTDSYLIVVCMRYGASALKRSGLALVTGSCDVSPDVLCDALIMLSHPSSLSWQWEPYRTASQYYLNSFSPKHMDMKGSWL